MMRTSNPALNDKLFSEVRAAPTDQIMTVEGTVNKTIITVVITMATAWWSFTTPNLEGLFWPALIVGLILGFIICFKANLAPILTPFYAVSEGVFLGLISAIYARIYEGIIFQAVTLTFGTLFCMLLAYKSGWIKVSDSFRRGVIAATGAIIFLYFISFVMMFFTDSVSFLHNSSLLSIGISGVIIVVAALNLTLDFDMIERGARSGSAPKYMEWYGAFALLVTLIWLYLEILRLLSKLQSRN